MSTHLCDLCVRRIRLMGGNDSCPLFRPRLVLLPNGGEAPAKDAEAWTRHQQIHPRACSNFVAGDLRRPAPKVDQEGLF